MQEYLTLTQDEVEIPVYGMPRQSFHPFLFGKTMADHDKVLVLNFQSVSFKDVWGQNVGRSRYDSTEKDFFFQNANKFHVEYDPKKFYPLDIDWPDYLIPSRRLVFWEAVRDFAFRDNFDCILCMCEGGSGRTGTGISALYIADAKANNKKPNVLKFIEFTRKDKQHKNFVETNIQFYYLATLEEEELEGIEAVYEPTQKLVPKSSKIPSGMSPKEIRAIVNKGQDFQVRAIENNGKSNCRLQFFLNRKESVWNEVDVFVDDQARYLINAAKKNRTSLAGTRTSYAPVNYNKKTGCFHLPGNSKKSIFTLSELTDSIYKKSK